MAKITAYYCPHMNACPIYENTLGEESEPRLNVITKDGIIYECLALKAYNDPASPHGRSEPQAEGENNRPIGCSHLELLNNTVPEL